MAHSRRDLARAYGLSAAVYVTLALLRSAFRILAIPRPPAAAILAVVQSLALAVPWIALTPPLLALIVRMGWERGRRGRIFGRHLGLALLLSLIDGAWSWTAVGWLGGRVTVSPMLWYLGRLDQSLFLYGFLAATGVARRRLRDLDAVSLRAARLESSLLGARLHVLSLQLHPHFLFNTLNAVSELVHRDAGLAAGLVRRLRTLLDQSLAHRNAQEVPLGEEVALLETYADIQRLRFEGSLTVEIGVDTTAFTAVVPRLVLQPLVENAIRHGTSRRSAPGRIAVRGWRVADRLVLEVEDDGVGLSAGPVRDGLGLGNTRARLHELYGVDARLELMAAPGRGALARLELPFRDAAVSGAPENEPAGMPSQPDLPETPSSIGWRRTGLAIAGGWIGAALVGTHEDLLAGWITHDTEPFLQLLRPRLGEALLWIPLTAAVLRYAAFLARRGTPAVRLVLAHVAGGLATLGVHLLAVRLLVTPGMDGAYAAGCLLYDLCAYVALASGAHAWTLGRFVAERRLEAARLDRDLAATRLATLRWRLHPAFLGHALEAIATLAARDPGRADELTGRLGELLRLLLDRAAGGQTTPGDEAELFRLQEAVRSLAEADAPVTSLAATG